LSVGQAPVDATPNNAVFVCRLDIRVNNAGVYESRRPTPPPVSLSPARRSVFLGLSNRVMNAYQDHVENYASRSRGRRGAVP